MRSVERSVIAAVYSLWAVATTPLDAKHFAARRRPGPVADAIVEPVAVAEPVPEPVSAPAPNGTPVADRVVDLVAMEAAEEPAAGLR